MRRYSPNDPFFRKAKKEGYRSRSAYKLKEVQERFQIFRKGDAVLDLGSSPGGFLQVIREAVGDRGIVIGVDILPIPPLPYKNVHFYQADVRTIDIRSIMKREGISGLDVITSDLSPNLSGITEVDEKNMLELVEASEKIVKQCLRKRGHFFLKTFFFPTFGEVRDRMETIFERTVVLKPKASRQQSSEIYILCLHKK